MMPLGVQVLSCHVPWYMCPLYLLVLNRMGFQSPLPLSEPMCLFCGLSSTRASIYSLCPQAIGKNSHINTVVGSGTELTVTDVTQKLYHGVLSEEEPLKTEQRVWPVLVYVNSTEHVITIMPAGRRNSFGRSRTRH